jgi:long-subunit acyl-CoA synthetase (AMP-forming)
MLDELNSSLESHERLSNVLIVDDEWTPENELLTPTLKVRRDQLEARYQPLLAAELHDRISWESDLEASAAARH